MMSFLKFYKKTDGTISRVLVSVVIRHNHLSRTQITLRLKQPTRSYGPENPLPLGFAPNEVCTAAPVTGCAGVSYTALSPLPVLQRAVYFLLHCLSNAGFALLQFPHPPGDYPAFFPAEPGLCLTDMLFHQSMPARLYPIRIINKFMHGAFRIGVCAFDFEALTTDRRLHRRYRRFRFRHRRYRLHRRRFRRHRRRFLFLRFPRLRLRTRLQIRRRHRGLRGCR